MALWISCIVFPLAVVALVFQIIFEIYHKLLGGKNETREIKQNTGLENKSSLHKEKLESKET